MIFNDSHISTVRIMEAVSHWEKAFKRKMWTKEKIYNRGSKIDFYIWIRRTYSFSLSVYLILISPHKTIEEDIKYVLKREKNNCFFHQFSLHWDPPRERLLHGTKWWRLLCRVGGTGLAGRTLESRTLRWESWLLFCHFFRNKRGQISLSNKEVYPPHYKPRSWEALSWTILLGKHSWKKLLIFLFLTYL